MDDYVFERNIIRMNTTQVNNVTNRIEIKVGTRTVRIIDSGDKCVSALLVLSDGQVNGSWSGSTVAGAKRWAARELSN